MPTVGLGCAVVHQSDFGMGLQVSNNGYCFLTMTAGSRAGTSFLLDPTDSTRVGRGNECEIVLVDPLCARVHAELLRENDGWWLRDRDSRNGTYLNGQRIEQGRLNVGHIFKVGTTEFLFSWSDQPPTMNTDTSVAERIVRQQTFEPEETNILTSSLRVEHLPEELMVLYQLSIKLLGTSDPDGVVEAALQRLRERTDASVVGFLWVNDEDRLTPKMVVPAEADGQVQLSQQLTDLVCRKSRGVWVAHQPNQESPAKFTDAICIPLIHQRTILGAIHLYRDQEHFHQKDFDFSISLAGLLVVALVRARQQATLIADHTRLVQSSASNDQLLGECEPMRELKAAIGRIAKATGAVLVCGESGVGKELIARTIHRESGRADRPLLSINCAALPQDQIDGQLFGRATADSPDKVTNPPGLFRQADSGTLFLDEIGELPPIAQAKLLQILEGNPFLPVDGSTEVLVDVRVIATSNRDLRHAVNDGSFREDLFYRLSVFEVQVPPLRERGGDIPLLVDHFLEHFKQHHGRPELTISDDAMHQLTLHNWPGNVRQLRNVVDSAVVMAEGDQILAEHLGLKQADEMPDSLRIQDWEVKLIREALRRTAGKVPDAAKLLGIGRATLYRKLDEYHIRRDNFQDG